MGTGARETREALGLLRPGGGQARADRDQVESPKAIPIA